MIFFISVDTKELVAAEVCYGQCRSGCVCAASLWYNVKYLWTVSELPVSLSEDTYAGSR